MLGVPLGSDQKAAAYVEKKLLGKLTGIVNKLADFDRDLGCGSEHLASRCLKRVGSKHV